MKFIVKYNFLFKKMEAKHANCVPTNRYVRLLLSRKRVDSNLSNSSRKLTMRLIYRQARAPCIIGHRTQLIYKIIDFDKDGSCSDGHN